MLTPTFSDTAFTNSIDADSKKLSVKIATDRKTYGPEAK
jgi:hypothetical protein